MAKDSSFDIVSEIDLNEMDNAINMAVKEIANRFDFKGSCSSITRSDTKIDLLADDDTRMHNLIDILETKMIKRELSIKFLDFKQVADALGGNVKQIATIQQGLSSEKLKELNKFIKEKKFKVKSQINGDKLKITAPKKDVLQAVIQAMNSEDFGVVLQFNNFR